MRWLLLIPLLFHLLPTAIAPQPLNKSTPNPPLVPPPLATGPTICISAQRATESHLKRINYRDCLPLLNAVLLDPNTNRQNRYDASTAYDAHVHATCAITLLASSKAGSDVFWGYEVAVAAARVVKGCVEEAVGGYGGVGFVADKVLFYAQVGDPEEGRASAARVNATGSSRATNILRSRSNNNVNATLRLPHPTAAMPVCQISHPRKLHLQPISLLDCYHLFYNLLASPAVERTIVLKGLSPIRYETYGTCTVQLRGNSAVAADTFKFVEVLLAAVRIVQTCVLSGGAELGGAVGVGPRGRYVVRVFNLVGEGSGDGVKSG